MCPDQIWADGSITNAARRIAEGYTAVLCPGPRSIEESMVPALRQRWLSDDGTSLAVPARELVKAGMENLHPEMKMWFWDDENYYRFPSYVFFSVQNAGMTAFCYILHPVVVNAQVRNAPFRRIFDQDYLAAACPDIERLYVARDSDEVFHFEVSPEHASIPPKPDFPGDDVEAMSWYGEYQFNHQHRIFVKEPVRIHHGPIRESDWSAVESRGRAIIAQIDANWHLDDEQLLETRPLNMIRRLESRYRFNPHCVTDRDRDMKAKALAKVGGIVPEG